MLRDFSAASRMLRRPGTLPAVVVVMLGTAIAAATSIFSIAAVDPMTALRESN